MILAASVLTVGAEAVTGSCLAGCDRVEAFDTCESRVADFVEVAIDPKRVKICVAKDREAASAGESGTALAAGFPRGIVACGFTLPEVDSGLN